MSQEGSYQHVARTLGVAPQTVTTHRAHIFRKLHVYCRQSAVAWYGKQTKRLLPALTLAAQEMAAGLPGW